jgi:lysophospholipase L1-like esterase
MSSTKSIKSAFFGWVFIGLVFYIFTTVCLFAFSAISIANKKIIDVWPINKYQQYFYFKAMRNIWQFDPRCAELNDYLIYQPKIGSCQFNNPEFETTLTFDDLGRKTPNRTSSKQESGIAMIGDSFTMGWGVNDQETFSNVLQLKTDKPIYNLGVSSYGTDREIRRLIQSKLISKIDTIVIQYCENDLNENEAIGDEVAYNGEKIKFNASFSDSKSITTTEKISLILTSLRAAISEPYKAIKRLVLGPATKGDFARHQLALHKVFNHYQDELKGKKILVFYLNGYEADYTNFPTGQDLNNQNITYFDFQKNLLSKQDFFSIDGHLNPLGHKNLGEAIAEHLKLSIH